MNNLPNKPSLFKCVHLLKRLFTVGRNPLLTPPLDDALAGLQAWYETKQGERTLNLQKKWVNNQISGMFGYHLMQMGVMPTPGFSHDSRIHHQFYVSPSNVAQSVKPNALTQHDSSFTLLQSSLTHLPLADDSIDVLIMHHALDFSENPQQVLSEASRVVVPNGHIVIMGYNPYSLWGCEQLLKRPFSYQPIYKPQNLRAGRVKDWLTLLQFTPLKTHYSPIGSLGQGIDNTQCFLRRHLPPYLSFCSPLTNKPTSHSLPIGGMYFIVARKDKACMTPIKPQWQKNCFLGVRSMPQKACSASAKEHYADILPLRLPNRK